MVTYQGSQWFDVVGVSGSANGGWTSSAIHEFALGELGLELPLLFGRVSVGLGVFQRETFERGEVEGVVVVVTTQKNEQVILKLIVVIRIINDVLDNLVVHAVMYALKDELLVGISNAYSSILNGRRIAVGFPL